MRKQAKLLLPNDATILLEAEADSAEKDVALFEPPLFNPEELRRPLEGLTQLLKAAIDNVKPDKAAVEFGLELGIESGQLTTLLVKGAGKAHVKVTVEWTRDKAEKGEGVA